MRWLSLSVFVVCFSTTIQAHHPDREHKLVHQRIDLIGPLGTHLPMSHRRRYNRPTKIGGRIAYCIAPSSQEAMAWHSAAHRNLYKDHRPRIETHYFYPKPWEALRIGARPRTTVDATTVDATTVDATAVDGMPVEYQPELQSQQVPVELPWAAPGNGSIPSDSDLIEP